ncbi:MAG: hypothetical protein ACM3SY_19325, partial [Candidatus Omnitrophota bacterium]
GPKIGGYRSKIGGDHPKKPERDIEMTDPASNPFKKKKASPVLIFRLDMSELLVRAIRIPVRGKKLHVRDKNLLVRERRLLVRDRGLLVRAGRLLVQGAIYNYLFE